MIALVIAQLVYALVGIGYNVVSIVLSRRGQKPLNDGPPIPAIIVIALYAVMLFMPDPSYRISMGVALIILGVPGVLAHIRRGPTEFYRSKKAWGWAIGINSAGAILNVAGLIVGAAF